ncbi:MAG: enoyl-CoA hydratase [Alphaproteobacteria bacterium]
MASEIRFPVLVDTLPVLVSGVRSLSVRRNETLEAIIVSKTAPGFSRQTVEALRRVVRELAAGRLGKVNFLVLDLAHEGFALSTAEEGFDDLLAEIETLILAAPVISIAAARADLAGADLELALACSMMVGREDVRFSFAADLLVSIGAYALLAQKLGFVRAERLMESGEILDANQMRDLCLLKDVLETDGAAGIEAYLRKTARRHNAWCGVYRAQRVTSPAVHQTLRQAH